MKHITAMILALAMLAGMTACNEKNTPANTTGTTTVTSETTGTVTTETTEKEETTAPVEEPFDADAFLADCIVYEVTTENYRQPYKDLEKLNVSDKPAKIALRFTDAEGLVAYMNQADLGYYYITHLQKNSLDVPLSINYGLSYGNNGFSISHESGITIIELTGGLHVFSRYHIIKGEEYNFISNTAAESGYALYVSVDDNGELSYRKHNEKYHRHSPLEKLLACESEDDFYCEDGTLYFENGTAVYVAESSMTLGEYFNSDNFDLKRFRDKYGVKSFGELAELYKQYLSEGRESEF